MPPFAKTFSVIGVDLAAQPKDTAYCEIVVNQISGTATIGMPKSGETDASDGALLEAFSQPNVARIGIDAPFGWPKPFVIALKGHAQSNVWPRYSRRNSRWFGDLALRATDKYVASAADVRPLSVSADKLGTVGMRAAFLLSRAPESLAVDRSGTTGHFVEVYPAAALAQWRISTTNYKKHPRPKQRLSESQDEYDERLRKWPSKAGWKARHSIGTRITESGLDLHGLSHWIDEAFLQSDHNVDAFVSALVGLMVELDHRLGSKPDREGLTLPIPEAHKALAEKEGWIALPRRCTLGCLAEELQALKS